MKVSQVSSPIDLIANKCVSRRGIFPFGLQLGRGLKHRLPWPPVGSGSQIELSSAAAAEYHGLERKRQEGHVNNLKAILARVSKRYLTTHAYAEGFAESIYARLPQYLIGVRGLLENM